MTKHINLDALEAGMDYLMNMNRASINKEKLEPISDQTCIYYNSVNIFCGRQGSGKTYSGMKEIIKISHISPETHLLVVITKDESKDDPTITSLLPLLNIPVVYVSEEEAEDYVKHLLSCKRMYNIIKQNHSESARQTSCPFGAEKNVKQEEKEELFETLCVDDFRKQWLHTIFLFNDIAKSKLFKRAEGYFNQLIPICRHIQSSFFLNVQFWKSIPTEIKANLTTAFIFGGFSKEQLSYILRQLPVAVEFQRIYNAYRGLRKFQKIIVNCETGEAFLD